jgi:2-dehydropantoate 2-reductase
MPGRSIAIMGAGSMGTLLGACLSRAGVSVDLIDVDRAHVEALNENGATVVGTVELHVPVRALTPGMLTARYDLVFLLVKQTHNQTAFTQLKPHLHEEGAVCTLQNGIPELAVAAAFGSERTLGCAVTWGATFLGPGKVQSTTAPEKWHSALGTLDGSATRQAECTQNILSLMGPTTLVSDLLGIRWSKLLVNSCFSGMSAVLGCTFGQILQNEKALRCAQYIARECIRVAKAQGVDLAPLAPGQDFGRSMDFDTEEGRLATSGTYYDLWGAAASGKASMLQDLESGRRTEIDYINGLVSNAGREFHVPTPFNDMVVRVVKGIESGRYGPGMENLRMFERL